MIIILKLWYNYYYSKAHSDCVSTECKMKNKVK
ncbi:hypothetical protein VPHK406_0273 [Vibrio phage K406]